MTDQTNLSRRGVIAAGASVAAVAALPAFALEDQGYALGDVVLGDKNAPVTIIEYASLTCPHCASFHAQAFPTIKTDYIDSGKARLIMREIYFDQFGLWAAMVARCGGDATYYPMIDTFLGRQRDWYQSHVGAYNETKNHKPIVDEMKKIGRLHGLSNDRMESCLTDQALLERMVTDYQTTSSEDGVRSTPTFFVNGEKIVGSVSAAEMAAAIDKHL